MNDERIDNGRVAALCTLQSSELVFQITFWQKWDLTRALGMSKPYPCSFEVIPQRKTCESWLQNLSIAEDIENCVIYNCMGQVQNENSNEFV